MTTPVHIVLDAPEAEKAAKGLLALGKVSQSKGDRESALAFFNVSRIIAARVQMTKEGE